MSSQLQAYIGRPKGKKNAKSHLYSDYRGHPLRLCDWLGMDEEVERISGSLTCLHCLKIQRGVRGAAFES